MNVVIGSIFRDSTPYLARYFDQVQRLRQILDEEGHTSRLVLVENDSQDETFALLERWGHAMVEALVIPVPGGRRFPSLDMPERWAWLAHECNHILDEITDDDDLLLYVESDLIWHPPAIYELLTVAEAVGAVTAPCLTETERYYDTWGSRGLDGECFRRDRPFHPSFQAGGVFEISACASIIACDAQYARKARFTDDLCFVGFSRQVRELNGGLWMDARRRVTHP